jgi:hypothetical protein
VEHPGQSLRHDVPQCARCAKARMVEIVSIALLVDAPGLIGYECPDCGYISSVLVPPSAPLCRSVRR